MKDSIRTLYNVHGNKVYFQKVFSTEYSLCELDLNTKAVKQVIKNSSMAGLTYVNVTGKYIFLSGAAFESRVFDCFVDMVRIPINSKSEKSRRGKI